MVLVLANDYEKIKELKKKIPNLEKLVISNEQSSITLRRERSEEWAVEKFLI